MSDDLNIQIWDLSSGTLLYTHDYKGYYPFNPRWSRTDLYLLYGGFRDYRYLNSETFKKETVEEPDERFQEPDRLHRDGNMLWIGNWRDGPLFLALPSHLDIKGFRCHDDRVCILSTEGRLLLKISCLDTYMKEYCHIESEPEGELRKGIVHWYNNHPTP